MKKLITLLSISAVLLAGCKTKSTNAIKLIPTSFFDTIIDKRPVSLYTLNNKAGITMQVTNYGARIVSIWTQDKNKRWDNIVLGRPSIDDYLNGDGERFLGAAIGRYGNRIANGQFDLNGVTYHLATYNDGQCLHGGIKAFDRQVWTVKKKAENRIIFSYFSKNYGRGFSWELNNKNDLHIN